MLEQYKKDILPPNADKDLLPDNDGLGKRKLLFVIAGATFALVFFLFLMGIFRSDEDALAVKDLKSEMVTKESFLALEEKLSTMAARVEKLEKEKTVAVAPVQEAVQMTTQVAGLQSLEEGVQMTNDALRNFISQAASEQPQETLAVEAPSKKEAVAKDVKAKAKKGKVATTQKPGMHIVQKGDTLSKISQRYYGTANRWKNIYDANKGRIANINNLKVGTELTIPEAKQ